MSDLIEKLRLISEVDVNSVRSGFKKEETVTWQAAEQIQQLQQERDAAIQEAKIQASELDTQKGIVQSLCDIFGLRVHDYHCQSRVEEALAKRDLERELKGKYDLMDELYEAAQNEIDNSETSQLMDALDHYNECTGSFDQLRNQAKQGK